MTRKFLFPLLFIPLLFSCSKKSLELTSPNSNLTVFIDSEDEFLLTLIREQDTIFENSALGFVVDGTEIFSDFKVKRVRLREYNQSWEPVFGKNRVVRNVYSEATYVIANNALEGHSFELVLRCYDDGFAYRFVFPEAEGGNSVSLNGETSALNFASNFTFWTYNGERHNLGPILWSECDAGEYRIPMVTKLKNDLYVGIHEAEIVRYAPFRIKKEENGGMSFVVSETKDSLGLQTSWRTFIVGESAADLVNSNLLVNLNPPCAIEDVSWIKPGRTMWDWRVWGYKTGSGFEYGLNTESHKRFIDFASENNIQYLLIDADWYGPEFDKESDPTSAREGVDIEECMAYAKEKDVGVFLYLNDVGAKKFGLERVLKQFADWGAVGVKYGFMRGTQEEKVRHTRRIVELCAEHKLMVNFHDGPVPPSGDSRTWPNLVTKEFCHSQADAKRSYFPETIVTTTFVNMMTGEIDNCDGWFDLNDALERVRVFQDIPGTVAAEVAKLIVVYSGLQVLPDAPEEYLAKGDLFECIKAMPASFDSFEVLDGEIGEYIEVVRRAGEDYFVGVLTNREARDLELQTDFLQDSTKYLLTIYEDVNGSHFEDNKEHYQIRRMEINGQDEVIDLKLAPGGGAALHFMKL